MKVTVKVPKEVEVKTVVINILPRYIGDTDDDDMPTDFPLLNEAKTAWVARVDIDTGVIENWPQGDVRKMYVKVCDEGVYSLLDADGDEIIKFGGYVPHGVVPGEYGDYIELNIDDAGKITNWPTRPDVSEFFRE